MRRLVAPALLLLAGCLDHFAPEVGPEITAMDPMCPGDSNPAVAVGYQVDIVDGVFRRGGCTRCHTGDGMGLRQSGLDLRSYTTLRAGGGRSGAQIVVDGDPCTSILVQKIGPSPPFGRQMPYDGPPYLSDSDIQLVRDWISEGAREN